MVRRAFVIASLLGAVSAAAALAVAPDIARFGKSLGVWAALRERGFTPATDADAVRRAAAAVAEQGGDSSVGKYCRFPPPGSPPPVVAANVAPNAGGETPLALDGQSRDPGSAGQAICTGDTTATATTPARGLIIP